MVVNSSTVRVGPITQALGVERQPMADAGKFLGRSFYRFADDLAWWVEAAKTQRQRRRRPCSAVVSTGLVDRTRLLFFR